MSISQVEMKGGYIIGKAMVAEAYPLSPTGARVGSFITKWEQAAEKGRMRTGIWVMCRVDIIDRAPWVE